MQTTVGSIDEDPGWENLQAWVKPKIPQGKIRKWLKQKRDRLALENGKIDGQKWLDDQFAVHIPPDECHSKEEKNSKAKKRAERVPPKKKGSKNKRKG